MEYITTYLVYFPISYITCLALLSKLSGKDRGRTYCNNIQIGSFFHKKQTKNTYNMHQNTNKYINNYMHAIIITFMKIFLSCVFTPAKSPFFVMIFFMFEQNPLGNLIFRMTSFTTLLCYSNNNHGSEFILIWSLFL